MRYQDSERYPKVKALNQTDATQRNNKVVLTFSESILAIIFWLPPLKISPIPQKTKGSIIIPTNIFTDKDLENFTIDESIFIFY